MNKEKHTRETALKSMHVLWKILRQRVLDDRSISESTMDFILTPFAKMEWTERGQYADQLTIILQSMKNQEEVIQRAAQARKEMGLEE